MTLPLWQRCRAWLLPALTRDGGSEAELLDDLATGRAQLWAGERAAIVTQCVEEASGLCLHVWLAGGGLAEILKLKPGIEAWARGQGCRRVTLDGRKGWTRVLRSLGYALNGTELERRL
jgi:hypothetical protein